MNTNYVGTRWHKCDLHLHTPASLCFKDRATVTPEQWVQEALNKGLSCVAVTDHNTGEWIDKIKAAAAGTTLTVFPGVEITCSDAKVHLLVLFDVNKTTQDITNFLLLTGIEPEAHGKQDAHANMTSSDVISLASGRGGIVIPAHIDEFNGICEIAHEPRQKLLKNKEIRAVQVVHKEFTFSDTEYNLIDQDSFLVDLNTYYNRTTEDIEKGKGILIDRIRTWRQATKQSIEHKKAVLTFSDNPHQANDSKHGLWGIGRRFTWIKMDKQPTLECLRQSLLIPEARIINDFNIADGVEPYKAPDIWIKKITFQNTEITEFEKVIEMEFSPQMSSIVGGRGSGKSTVLSFVRGLFPAYKDQLKDVPSIKSEFDTFFREPVGSPKKGVLNPATEIEILIHRKNTLYKIVYKVNEGDISKVYRFNNSDDSWVEQTEEGFIDLFELDIFSQKQVFEIANRPNALRNKIDKDIAEVAGIKQYIEELKSSFLTHCAQIRELQVRISEKTILETEIRDIETRLAALDVAALKELLQKRQEFSTQEGELHSFQTDLNNQLTILKDAVESFQFPSNLPSLISEEGVYKSEMNELITPLKLKFEDLQTQLNQLIDESKQAIITFSEQLESSQWKTDKLKTEQDYSEQQELLQSEGLEDLSDPDEIEAEMDTAQLKRQQIHNIEKLENELEVALKEKEKIKEKYFEKREELTSVRLTFLQNLLEGNVRAKVKKCGDLDHWENIFRNIINSHGSHRPDLEALRDRWQLGRTPFENNESFMTIFSEIRAGTYRGGDFSGHFINRIKGLGEPQMDELDLLIPEDMIIVEYKSNEKSNFQPIATASPGQKTAAILTFLLSHGDRPLIIDQPEDDLDTSLIHSLVVNQLRSSKVRRQVIVVTHNPNIPVNGDSEYVVVMNSNSKHVEPKYAGSIDDDEIRKLICDVMEGGIEAFNLRSQRYKLS